MKKRKCLFASAILLLVTVLSGCNLVVFDPQGPQARKITELINFSLVWIGLVVVVVLALFIWVVVKYRATPENEGYEPPNEEGNKWLEIIWTSIPIVIVTILTIPTIKTLVELEEVPEGYKDKEVINIHVTSADWKWIFSYPEEGIETVDYVTIPVNKPVNFKLTSAGTQQSFWIPSLAGQKYTMPNMETELIVVAEREGQFWGKNTNFNGEGYSEMVFEVDVKSETDFEEWVAEVQELAPELTQEEYANKILKPSVLGQRLTYSNTHLDFIDHAEYNSDSYKYVNTEDYLSEHEYPGRIFEEDEGTEQARNADLKNHEENGGGPSGH
ncbi:cytochrome aa3 quinol oxidase subunit II [Caldifermentibacillus hisashii]|uniref:cytochrome aa3 quinol oxidase subunit II n=1 Tax=Caldifermentibacillus hisashii TaxID=996558 RepID=UPI003D1B47B7